jgi:hypothetical protein
VPWCVVTHGARGFRPPRPNSCPWIAACMCGCHAADLIPFSALSHPGPVCLITLDRDDYLYACRMIMLTRLLIVTVDEPTCMHACDDSSRASIHDHSTSSENEATTCQRARPPAGARATDGTGVEHRTARLGARGGRRSTNGHIYASPLNARHAYVHDGECTHHSSVDD